MRVLLFLLIFNTFAFGLNIYDLAKYCQKYGQEAANDIATYFHLSDVKIYKNCSVSQRDVIKYKIVIKGNFVYLDSTLRRVGLIKGKRVGLSEVPIILSRLRRFYKNNGYFDVKISSEIKNDACIIRINEGKLYVIGNIYINKQKERNLFFISQIMTEKNINKILEKVEYNLRKRGFFDYKVDYEVKESKYSYPFFSKDKFLNSVFSFLPFFHKIVDIHFKISSGEKYDLKILGIKDDDLKKSVKELFVKDVAKLNSFYIGLFKENTKEFLQNFGFESPFVKVSLFGKKIYVKISYERKYQKLNVKVVTYPNDEFLKNKIEKFLKRKRFDIEISALKSFIKKVSFDKGYCNPVIKKAFIKDYKNELVVNLEVLLGRKCSLGKIFLNGNRIDISGKNIQFFEIEKIKNKIYEKLKDSYYFEYISYEKYEVKDDKVNLFFSANSSKLYLREIIYFDRESIPQKQISKVLKKGDLITRSKIDNLKLFLRQLGYFEESSVNVLRIGDRAALIVVYNKVRPKNQIYGGLGYTSVSGFNAYLGYKRLNLFYHNLNTYYFASLEEQKFNFNLLGYSILIFDAYDEFDFTYHLKKDDYFTIDSKKLMLKFSRGFENHTISLNLKFDKLKEYNLDYDESVQKYAVSGAVVSFGFGYNYQVLDDRVNPLNGYNLGIMLDIFRNFEKNYFYKYSTGGTFFKSFNKNRYLFTAKVKGGVLTGENDSIPISYRFRLGGPDKLKGYGVSDIGCKDGEGRVFGGKKFVYFEMAMGRIFKKIVQVGLFYEMGNAFDDVGQIFKYKDLGVMFELRTPIGPLKFTYANNYLFSDEKSQAFYITFGRVF